MAGGNPESHSDAVELIYLRPEDCLRTSGNDNAGSGSGSGSGSGTVESGNGGDGGTGHAGGTNSGDGPGSGRGTGGRGNGNGGNPNAGGADTTGLFGLDIPYLGGDWRTANIAICASVEP